MKRRFSGSERIQAFVVSKGHCRICGIALTSGFHADHVVPYSKGGATDTSNVQALCPACNLKKGSRVEMTANIQLRDWQLRARDKFRAHQERDFLLVATPGAGKTAFALNMARDLIEARRIQRITVVVPTAHLCRQWIDAAHSFGIHLQIMKNQDVREAPDFHGYVTTYKSVSTQPLLHALNTERGSTLTILDEIHHAGEERAYGDSIKTAFEKSAYNLCMSGTPFRSDNNYIPFIQYEGAGTQKVSKSDFSYNYGQALIDRVCRQVIFPSFDGNVSWLEDEEYFEYRLKETKDLDDETASRVLFSAVRNEKFLADVFSRAHETLMRVRTEEQPDAGGLVIAMDIHRAKACARYIEKVTGVKPYIAVSDSDESEDPTKQIKEFANSDSPWIVAVRMISEGVDIPRLRVCIYNTNVKAPLFFIQAVGRVVRMMKNAVNSDAYFFIPEHRDLVALALEIIRERNHAIQQRESKPLSEREMLSDRKLIIPHEANAEPSQVIYVGEQIPVNDYARLDTIGRELNVPTSKMAVIAHRLGPSPVSVSNGGQLVKSSMPQITKQDEVALLRNRVNKIIHAAAGWYYKSPALSEGQIKEMWKRIREATGLPYPLSRASAEEMRHALQWVNDWMKGNQGE